MSGLKIFSMVDSFLEQYRERLGDLYEPASRLLAAALFVFIAGLILGIPLALFSSMQQLAPVWAAILLVYYMVLGTERMDRFAFVFILYIILAAGVPALLLECELSEILRSNPNVLTNPVPISEIFIFGFIRGVGITAWALPILFYYYIFYSSITMLESTVAKRRIMFVIFAGCLFQTITCCLTLWLGKLRLRCTAPTDGAPDYVVPIVTRNQSGYLWFTISMFAVGFIILLTLWLLRKRLKDSAWLTVTLAGMLVIQVLFVVSSINHWRIDRYYPAANGRVEAYRQKDNDKVVYKRPIFDDITTEILDDYVVLGVCDNPESNEFENRVIRRTEFESNYDKLNIEKLIATKDLRLFCQ